MNTSPVKIDPLLEPFLTELDDAKADELLLQLINAHTEPVIKGVIRYKLRLSSQSATQHAEAEDINQETLLQLLSQLREFRELPDRHPISDLRGMAAIIAHRACSRWMRRQFPERHALKNRLHYLLTRQAGFAFWQNEDRKVMVGFAAWQGQKQSVTAEQLKQLSEDEGLAANIRWFKSSGQQAELSQVLATIFNRLGHPVEFDELVSALAALFHVRDQPVDSTDPNENTLAL